MALDVGKIIDKLKLSYGQLRNLLITSIGTIATVWLVGVKVGGVTTKMDAFGDILTEIKTEIVLTRTTTESGLNKIYTDFASINKTNNELWNNKFSLLLEYGDENKELLQKLLDYEDKRAAAELNRINTSKDYDVVAEPVEEKKTETRIKGEATIVAVDDDGNAIGDTVTFKYGEEEKKN